MQGENNSRKTTSSKYSQILPTIQEHVWSPTARTFQPLRRDVTRHITATPFFLFFFFFAVHSVDYLISNWMLVRRAPATFGPSVIVRSRARFTTRFKRENEDANERERTR